MAKRRDAKREGFWRRVLRRRAGSGMTIAEFCASEGLKTTTYHYWHREIKRRDAASPSEHAVSPPEDADAAGRPLLVPVQLVEDRSAAAAVEIVAGNGLVIRVGDQATTEHVRRVLQAVIEVED